MSMNRKERSAFYLLVLSCLGFVLWTGRAIVTPKIAILFSSMVVVAAIASDFATNRILLSDAGGASDR